ncbi:sugar phosphate isomerase/epimerase [Tissierella praeacuta]|uniref:sugar phosphate isomerase/epimerase family protein n=1 Tax=Tissierella praeacuta TaxID=43131 RepID=UPI0033411CCB
MRLGVQLYSVRSYMEKDLKATMRKLSKIGYRNFETANSNADKDCGIGFNISAKELAKLLEDIDSSVISAHISPITKNNLESVLNYYKELGTKYIVMPMDFYCDRDDVLRKTELWNWAGEQCKKYDMEFLYHNHFYEFQKIGKETVYDLILNNTDENLVKIELDTYWVMRGGQDVYETLTRLGKRIKLIHQKDYPKGLDSRMNLIENVNKNSSFVNQKYFEDNVKKYDFTEINFGIMDIQRIIDTAVKYNDVSHFILEQDYSQYDEFESVKKSFKQLKNMKNIDF